MLQRLLVPVLNSGSVTEVECVACLQHRSSVHTHTHTCSFLIVDWYASRGDLRRPFHTLFDTMASGTGLICCKSSYAAMRLFKVTVLGNNYQGTSSGATFVLHRRLTVN